MGFQGFWSFIICRVCSECLLTSQYSNVSPFVLCMSTMYRDGVTSKTCEFIDIDRQTIVAVIEEEEEEEVYVCISSYEPKCVI